MKLHYPVVLLCASLALMACGEEKKAENAPAKPAAAQTSAPATDTKTQATGNSTDANKDATDATAKPSEPTPADTTAKAEMVKPASLEVGKARYEATCKVCHDQGMLDAPKLSDKAGWAKRAEQGVETLYQHSAQGFNKMPAQASAEVSEAEVYAAVDYMLSQAK
ncbi:c-type cytochrome [Moraxella pluranimalium]|uniref:Cytochrome c domain-containing protein n=1 Tax=Moraxella pluranimalium TaxID=470453 RepID=A0A1T0CLG5_9GAMM|nr:c-type cytochrome [Moraxella pluranimalium]OOS23143.1 hypothetical protein B0680_08265 [Moraxella pluranimalium]